MNYPASKYIPAIEECFRNWGDISVQSSEAQWDIVSHNAPRLPVHASLTEDWLRLQADTGIPAENGRISSALQRNGTLNGAAKFSLRLQNQSIGVCGEIPLDNEADIMTNLNATLSGFGQAALLIHNSSGRDTDPASKAAFKDPIPDSAPSLQQLLAETGWPFTERSEGNFMVELDTRAGFHQALIKTGQDGFRRTSVELAVWEAPAPASRDALAVMLLTAAGMIRMVRPILNDSGERVTAGFEICFSPGASPSVLDRGFSSLSIACRFCGREASALNNPKIAGEYLAVRHFNIE